MSESKSDSNTFFDYLKKKINKMDQDYKTDGLEKIQIPDMFETINITKLVKVNAVEKIKSLIIEIEKKQSIVEYAHTLYRAINGRFLYLLRDARSFPRYRSDNNEEEAKKYLSVQGFIAPYTIKKVTDQTTRGNRVIDYLSGGVVRVDDVLEGKVYDSEIQYSTITNEGEILKRGRILPEKKYRGGKQKNRQARTNKKNKGKNRDNTNKIKQNNSKKRKNRRTKHRLRR
jgi:hypothetical protein